MKPSEEEEDRQLESAPVRPKDLALASKSPAPSPRLSLSPGCGGGEGGGACVWGSSASSTSRNADGRTSLGSYGSSSSSSREEEEEGGLVDELDNQIITAAAGDSSSDHSCPQQQLQQQLELGLAAAVELERKVIGDEFYRDEEEEESSPDRGGNDSSDLLAESGVVEAIIITASDDKDDTALGVTATKSTAAVATPRCQSIRDIQEDIKTSPVQSPLVASFGTDDDCRRRQPPVSPDVAEQQQPAVIIARSCHSSIGSEKDLAKAGNNINSCCTPPRYQPTSVLVYTARKSAVHQPLAAEEKEEEYFGGGGETAFYDNKNDVDQQQQLLGPAANSPPYPVGQFTYEGGEATTRTTVVAPSTVVGEESSAAAFRYPPVQGATAAATTVISGYPHPAGGRRSVVTTPPEVAVAAPIASSGREPGSLYLHGLPGGHHHAAHLFDDDLSSEDHPDLRGYDGGEEEEPHYHTHVLGIMTASTHSEIDSVLVNTIVKNEPEDLTGRHRHSSDQLSLDVTAKTMGIVTSPDGDSIVLNSEDLPLAPGFSTTATTTNPSTVYDPPTFSSTAYTSVADSRLYDPGYRDDGLYEPASYRSPTYYISGSGTPGLSVDLPSSDSGIGPEQITPREIVNDTSFEYSPHNILEQNTIRKPWHDYGRGGSDTEKVQIQKVFSHYGFKYYLDAPTSSSVRREDDKVTYINKGQFYGVTLEYVRSPDSHLKSPTVKSVIMLVFREGKSQEEEIKAWQFWHQRQHSVKQRIIDVDTKNSHGLVGHIEELSHNAIAVYWNPLESFAKVNLAVQCLSTDFSTQKGVKGLPLHIQIDTYEDPRLEVGAPASHRGYCQVKIFCDKGAERKLRDEERRAAKRRMTPSGKRRLDEMYHETFERSDFYSMSDLNKPPTLFTPPEDPDKATAIGQDFPGYYSPRATVVDSVVKPMGNGDLHILPGLQIPEAKRARLMPPVNERIMVYVRQETEDVYTPLHLVPPSVPGLIGAIENKYKINATNIRFLYRKNREGILAKIDDDMLRHYCNEDVFLMQVMVTEGPGGEDTMVYDITLSEIQSNMEH